MAVNDSASLYATVVYNNDESFTFEQVTEALQLSLGMSPDEADHITLDINRDGRAIIRCSSFQVKVHFNRGSFK